jgi:hypothetical protein
VTPHSRTELAWPELRGAAPRRLHTPPPDLRWTLRFPAGPTFAGRSAAGEGAEEERRPAGVAGHDSAPGRRRHSAFFSFHFFAFSFLPFLICLTSGPSVHISKLIFSLPCQPYMWDRVVSFSINSGSIQNQCTLLAISKKIVVFCDSNVRS